LFVARPANLSSVKDNMLPAERRATAALALVYGLRMLGLFVVLPVFAMYVSTLPGGESKTMVGVALGAYGLTQALLQIPFGLWSDRIGRKPVIYIGMLLFALGSAVAALATNVHVMLLGRVLQGAGAISGAVLALTADLTRESVRTKAMAAIGMTIGLSFVVSIALAPVLVQWIGVPGIFWMTALLALAGIAVIATFVPNPAAQSAHVETQARRRDFARVLKHADLLRLNLGIFVLHAILMAVFLVVPFQLQDMKLETSQHWKVYLPVMLASIVLMVPLIVAANRGGKLKAVFVGVIVLLVLAQLVLASAGHAFWVVVLGMVAFFTAFNVLEATLPSLISRVAPPDAKGTALGIYSSIQFLGPALGASAAGYLLQHHGAHAVFAFGIALTVLWLVVALPMRMPAPRRDLANAATG
jgi:MFS family permease